MKTDRELLKLAAKAHGSISFDRFDLADVFLEFREGGMNHWNPLTDDGDALRLAVKLGFTVEPGKCWRRPYGPAFGEDVLCGEMKATRRAIVRAAAAIGGAMSLLGKPCPECGAPLVSLSSLSNRICSGCKREQEWALDDGQKPLINTSRGDRKK